jgi:LL-H family phage holin
MIDICVRAAEQTTKGSGMGPIKKEDVMIAMTNWLSQKGIEMSQKQLSDLIEAAVYNMNEGF